MYSAEINRKQPALLALLVDQSFSMSEPWGRSGGSKADALAAAVNNLLGNAVLLCSKGGEKIYNYFEVGVFGYGAGTGPILHGAERTRPILPVDEVANNPRRVDTVSRRVPDGAGGVIEEQQQMPVWVDPIADGATPMVSAFSQVEPVIATWCAEHPSSFPPIVINVTDGASTDGDPCEIAARIRALGTDDGEALVFNLHLSGAVSQPVIFPNSDAGMTDPNARMLFEMSSPLPPAMLEAAASMKYPVQSGSRGFLYNADAAMVIDFLDIGTRAVTPTGLKDLTDGANGSDASAVDRPEAI
ncbi:VWA domain-containing protein [Nocardia transvalensis]|uniref:VWA domain-containing protein n=1 Tax=Nocardia transvalensis TaxID=37333 RepID=UPI0018958106|nr:VWA domain-containing protein [Nocardia transvalensis]MBF6333560.1 VWA domain-containing protein [Nocardia transvalensis]